MPERGDSGEATLNLDILPLGRPSLDGKVGMVPLPAISSSTQATAASGLATTGWSTKGLTAADMELHPSIHVLRAQERALRALMDKAGAAATTSGAHSGRRSARRHVTTPPSTTGSHMCGRLYDPEVSRLSEQLIKACSSAQRPGALLIRPELLMEGPDG